MHCVLYLVETTFRAPDCHVCVVLVAMHDRSNGREPLVMVLLRPIPTRPRYNDNVKHQHLTPRPRPRLGLGLGLGLRIGLGLGLRIGLGIGLGPRPRPRLRPIPKLTTKTKDPQMLYPLSLKKIDKALLFFLSQSFFEKSK